MENLFQFNEPTIKMTTVKKILFFYCFLSTEIDFLFSWEIGKLNKKKIFPISCHKYWFNYFLLFPIQKTKAVTSWWWFRDDVINSCVSKTFFEVFWKMRKFNYCFFSVSRLTTKTVERTGSNSINKKCFVDFFFSLQKA